MHNDAIGITKRYISAVKDQGIKIDTAYLYGSFAKGKTWEGSDIDICLISSEFGHDYLKEKSQLNKLSLKIDPRIEPVLFSPEDFANKYDSLVGEIKRFGIQII